MEVYVLSEHRKSLIEIKMYLTVVMYSDRVL